MEEDERFKHIRTDPRFRRIPKREEKVKIDKRFQSMFSDRKFKIKYSVDKRGRPVDHTSSEDLRRYYHLSSEDEEESGSEEDEAEAGKYVRAPAEEDKEAGSELKQADIPTDIKKKLKDLSVDYARGECSLLTESSSDESDSEAEAGSDGDAIVHGWGELDVDADTTEESTRRLAACNMDWDRIRAVDIMVLLSSFLPPTGVLESVTVYPSEFGLERMKEEELHGPKELVEAQEDEPEAETEEGARFHMEKLRQYQLNRLKYYYAVIACDSPSTAEKLYNDCNGMEYESTATKVDLRFIPDDMEFDQEPKEACTELPDPSKYMPRFFATSALQQVKVNLTWDETDPSRVEMSKKLMDGKVDDVTEEDLKEYLASSSDEGDAEAAESEESADEQLDPISKYKSLLQEIEAAEEEKRRGKVELEETFGLNVRSDAERLVKKKLAQSEIKTPFQQFLEKRKEKQKAKREEKKKTKEHEEQASGESSADDVPEGIDLNDKYFAEEFEGEEFKQQQKKKKGKGAMRSEADAEQDEQKKAELELLLLDENQDTRNHFNLKKIMDGEKTGKKKGKKRKKAEKAAAEDNFQVDVKDDRFSALYSSHHFNIDPTDPHFKKTKAMEAFMEEKLKRRETATTEVPAKGKKFGEHSDPELSLLVKSVKRNANIAKKRKI